jgi:PAS domain S-box-containing protein
LTKKATYEALEQELRNLKKKVVSRNQGEALVRESERRLSQILHGLSIAAFVIDRHHTITHCNRAFENLTGLSAQALIGTKNQWKTFYPAERPTLADFVVNQASEEELEKYYHGKYMKSPLIERAYEVEDFYPHLSGGGKWLFFTAAPLIDEEGNVTGAIETLQDITDRIQAEQRLRKSERRLRALLDFEPYPIVVFTLDGSVSYLNPAFSETFGWTLEELEGKRIPFVPPGLEQETREGIERLMQERVVRRDETQRLTKDGRILDVVIRVAVFAESGHEPAGIILILRDVTEEKRIARTNEAMIRISTALPEYPDLEDLLDYVNDEVKRLLNAEGSVVLLLDQEKKEFYVLGAAYDAIDTQKRVKEVRFSMDQLVAGKVVRSGQPMIVSDTSREPHLHEERDKRLGYKTRNLILVPLRSRDRIIGVLSAINKKEGDFDEKDQELLGLIAGTVALSIENAKFSEELKKAYREVSSLNRAKDKAINHLSHELKTPVAILTSSFNILSKRLADLPKEVWKPTTERIKRNLDRILEIQYEVDDIIENKQQRAHGFLHLLLEQCADALAGLVAEQCGEGSVVETVRGRIDEIYGLKVTMPAELRLDQIVGERLEYLKPLFAHRELEILSRLEATPVILIPLDVLHKVIDGLIKNAVENTPEEGKVEVAVIKKGEGALFLVRDYGVGIPEEARKRIFEGFFPARDTMAYSSKRPFDFNAGGKGADLLRMKIFSERYHFEIEMASTRCKHIPKDTDVCPSRISQCPFCSRIEDCHKSGGTIFSLYFPPAES